MPIVIGKSQPAPAVASRSSQKKGGEEEEAGDCGGPGLGDLVSLSSPHSQDWGGGRSLAPLHLPLPQREVQGVDRQVQTEELELSQVKTEEQEPAATAATQQDAGCQSDGRSDGGSEGGGGAREVETQTEDGGGCGHDGGQGQGHDGRRGQGRGTQTIPVAMSQATVQTDTLPIQVGWAATKVKPSFGLPNSSKHILTWPKKNFKQIQSHLDQGHIWQQLLHTQTKSHLLVLFG